MSAEVDPMVDMVARVLADETHGDSNGRRWPCWEGCWKWNTGQFHKKAQRVIEAIDQARKAQERKPRTAKAQAEQMRQEANILLAMAADLDGGQ